MGIMQNRKGKAGERELARRLTKLLGVPKGSIYRSRQYCGAGGDHGDVLGVEGLHIESKRQERGTNTLYKWIDQASEDAGRDDVAVVMHRMSLRPWICVIELEDIVKFAYTVVAAVEANDDDKNAK